MTRYDFEQFIKEQQEPLRRFLLNLLGGNGSLADDIAQDAFIKAYKGLSSFQGKSKMSTWLFKIAYNTFLDEEKKNNRFDVLPDVERRGATVIDETATAETMFRNKDLYFALEHLNGNEKAVLLLFYMEDKKIKEISRITGIGQNTVKSHLVRGRENLKRYLTGIGYGN